RFLIPGAGVVAQQEIMRDGPWKFRRAAESTVLCVEGAGEYREAGVESALGNGRSAGRRELRLFPQFVQYIVTGVDNPLAILAPGSGDAMERIEEAGRREVSPADERLQVGRQPHRHGPTAAAR